MSLRFSKITVKTWLHWTNKNYFKDGNIIYGIYSEDVDEEEYNKMKHEAKLIDEL